DAPLVPKSRDVKHRVLDGGVAPVQVGLLRVEEVVVILIRCCGERPRRAAENGSPIVRRLSWPLALAPNVPIAMFRSSRRLRIQKPFVLVGRVIHDKIEDDANPVSPGLT